MPFLRKYNTLLVTGTTSIRIPIIKRGVVDFAIGADWTPAAGDVKVFVDAVAVANITNLPTAIAAGNTAQWEFILTAAELSCKQILVMISDAATKAVEDQSFIIETYGNASAMYAADLSLANLPANVTQWLGTACAVTTTAGVPEVDVTYVAGTLQTAGDLATMITAVDDFVDTEVAAIKTDTAAILIDTAEIGAAGAGLTALGDTRIANLDAIISTRATPAQILTTVMTEAYAVDGAAPTLAQAIFALISALTEFSITDTTITCKKLDGVTTAMTFTLNDGTNPTSRTRAT